MAIDAKMRCRIDKLLGIYVGHLERHMPGWGSENALVRLAQYRGDLPQAEHYDQSNTTMINAIERLRKEHAHLRLAVSLLGRVAVCSCGGCKSCKRCAGAMVYLAEGRITPANALAMLCERMNRAEGQAAVAAYLGLTRKAFDGRLARGRDELADQIRFFDEAAEIGNILKSIAIVH